MVFDAGMVGRDEFPQFLDKGLTGNLAIGNAKEWVCTTGRVQIHVKLNSGTVSAGIVSIYTKDAAGNWAKVIGCDYNLHTVTDASHVSPVRECGMGRKKFVVTGYAGSSYDYDLGKQDY